jgi:hypothetical protein
MRILVQGRQHVDPFFVGKYRRGGASAERPAGGPAAAGLGAAVATSAAGPREIRGDVKLKTQDAS